MKARAAAPPPTSWPEGSLRSPANGQPLTWDAPHSLTDGERRWPVVEGIPYLRAGREELRAAALDALDRGEERAALVELLRDRDDWASGPTSDPDAVAAMLDGSPTLREAMKALGFGPVGDYFLYRLSDPTYLAGLALLRTCWNAPGSSFELACGIGHYSRELARRGIETAGGDVVFAKLWLARRFVSPGTRLVCFDASAPFPLAVGSADLVLCQDALYFLPEKEHVAGEMRRIAGPGGAVAVGHAHNALAQNLSAGEPLPPEGYANLFPDALLFDDAELTGVLVAGEEPAPKTTGDLAGSEAVCLASGTRSQNDAPDLAAPPPGTPLRPNPLYDVSGNDPATLRLRWPSGRYEEEYAPRSGYLPEEVEVPRSVLERAARGMIGSDPDVDRLARRRVLLDLPEGWW